MVMVNLPAASNCKIANFVTINKFNHPDMSAKFIQWAAVLGALAVVIGAFGAHGLKPHLSEYQISIFEKGVQYHFVHTLALLGVALLADKFGTDTRLKWSAWFFILGILFFSGSFPEPR